MFWKDTMRSGFLLGICLLWLVIGCTAIHQCPPEVDIEPCTCETSILFITVTCSNITNTDALYAVFDKSGDYPFDDLELTDSSFMYLPATAVKRKEIQQLRITNCVMTSIFESRPDPANSMNIISIKDTRFLRGIDWNFFSSFSKLRDLSIVNVEVKKIGKLFKDNINTALESIKIVSGKTAVLEDGVFSSLVNLKDIEVRDCMIKTLKRSMFPPRSELSEFNFRRNLIKSLPEDIFSNMPHLRVVFLDDNRLTTLPEAIYSDVFKRFDSYISFSNNPVNCDCSIVWFLPMEGLRVIQGTCDAPPSKKGRRFTSLSTSDFPQCRKV